MSNKERIDFLYNLVVNGGTSEEKRPWVALAQQLVENAWDAGATRIDFWIDPSNHFRCADNGEGVRKEKVKGLNTLGIRNKEKGSDTFGKNNSGRLFCLKVADTLRYRFGSADYDTMMVHDFGREDLRTLLKDMDVTHVPRPVESRPDWWPLKKGETGTSLELCGIDGWGLMKGGVVKFMNELSNALSVWTARMVYVENEPLPVRFTEGEFEGEFDHAKLGRIRYLFYHLQNPKRNDVIQIGRNPICTLEKFVDGIHKDEVRNLLKGYGWLLGNTVSGFIDVPEFNEYAHHTRNFLNPEMYEDDKLIEQFVLFLRKEIVPRLEDRYRLRDNAPQRDAKEEELDDLAEMMNPDRRLPPPPLDGDDKRVIRRKPHAVPPEIVISPPRLQLAVGTSYVFKVRRGPRNGAWNTSQAGGTLDVNTGREVNYTAGEKTGKYRLIYHKRDALAVQACVEIDIVERLPFQLAPGKIDLFPRDEKQIQVNNYDGDTVEWSIQGTEDIRLVPRGKYAEIQVGIGCMPGFYTVSAKGENGESGTAKIEIHPYEGRQIQIDDFVYQLEPSTSKSPLVSIRKEVFDPSGSQNEVYGVIEVNMDAEALRQVERQYGKQARLPTVMNAIVNAHIDKNGLAEPTREFERILCDTLQRNAGKKRKKKS